MKPMSKLFALVGLGLMTAGSALATPSTLVWNPSTDIQATGSYHLGLDSYWNEDGSITDLGLTYGLTEGLEVGVDWLSGVDEPLFFNAKWGIPERENAPAFAVGGQFIGTDDTALNMYYALVAKTFGTTGRFTLGGYIGDEDALGGDENSGFILAWDKAFTDKWWGSVDYASGDNIWGVLGIGAAYKYAPNVGFLFGYIIPNADGLSNQYTAQVDIDF